MLLRGINVGGNNKIAMAELKSLLADLGYSDIKTLLNSGNAVVSADDAPAKAEQRVRAAIKKELGLTIDVMARTHDELAAAVTANPLESVADKPSHYAVGFLQSKPPSLDAFKAIDAQAYAPECWQLAGRELFIWYANGQARTKLTGAFFEKRLRVPLTARNWNTVLKLAELTAA